MRTDRGRNCRTVAAPPWHVVRTRPNPSPWVLEHHIFDDSEGILLSSLASAGSRRRFARKPPLPALFPPHQPQPPKDNPTNQPMPHPPNVVPNKTRSAGTQEQRQVQHRRAVALPRRGAEPALRSLTTRFDGDGKSLGSLALRRSSSRRSWEIIDSEVKAFDIPNNVIAGRRKTQKNSLIAKKGRRIPTLVSKIQQKSPHPPAFH